MFWKFFSGAFGLVLGILLALIAFIFLLISLIILVLVLGNGDFEEKTKCLRCQEKRKNKIILAGKKYPTKKLCPDCKEQQAKEKKSKEV